MYSSKATYVAASLIDITLLTRYAHVSFVCLPVRDYPEHIHTCYIVDTHEYYLKVVARSEKPHPCFNN